MDITEVKIFRKDTSDKKLKAFATVTFDDCFVVRDLKVIDGTKGPFVAMPSRRMKEPCQGCGHRNVVRSKHCNNCGKTLEVRTNVSRQDEHKDIAHPITLAFREVIQKAVLDAYDSGSNYTHTKNPSSDKPSDAGSGGHVPPVDDAF
ncbi:MAG: SpoVG family protein [Candidatus Omnitrophica bacterium]|nr:SpoVG family protein [Candidatus Omnitrophota bacterium]